MDPITVTVVGGLAAIGMTHLIIASIRRKRRDPKAKMRKAIKKTKRDVDRASDDYLNDTKRARKRHTGR